MTEQDAHEPEVGSFDENAVESESPVATIPAAPVDPRVKWYVVHTYSGYEKKVQDNLLRRIDSMKMRDHIFQVLVPTKDEIEFKDGKKKTVVHKIYPGYVFVEMILTEDSWYVVRNTSGVAGFVTPGNGGTGPNNQGARPVPLDDEEVSKLKQLMGLEAPVRVKIDLAVGQTVKVIYGAFQDVHGLVEEVNPEREKVRVLLPFLGREAPVELDFGQVEKLS